jgi:hypothetical protein
VSGKQVGVALLLKLVWLFLAGAASSFSHHDWHLVEKGLSILSE